MTLSDLDERRPLDLEAVVIHELLGDIAADVVAVQPDRDVSVVANSDVVAHADRDQLTQALTALTANALRYTPVATPLELRATKTADQCVRLAIRDYGPGIAATDMPHVFERRATIRRPGHLRG